MAIYELKPGTESMDRELQSLIVFQKNEKKNVEEEKRMFGWKRKTEQKDTYEAESTTVRNPYDPAIYRPVLKCSICNGDQVAGFKNKQTGKFEEVAFIRDDRELDAFLRQYGLSHIDKEY